MKIIFGSLLLSYSAVASSQSVEQVIEGSIQLLNSSNKSVIYSLPVPPGKWKITHVNNRSSTGAGSAKLKDVRLIKVREGKLQEAIEITYHAESLPMQWNDEFCKVEPTLHKNNYGTRLWKQKCLTITAGTFLQNNNEATRLILDALEKDKVTHDLNSIVATYSRFGDFGKFLVIRRHFFPSTHGLENPVVTLMNTSPYHPARALNEPTKKKYIESLTKYMEDVVTSLDLAYEGTILKSISDFDPMASMQPTALAPTAGNLDEKIQALENAKRAGLLTDEEYNNKKRQISQQ